MSLFRVILNDTVLEDEPIGIERLVFKFERDDTVRGLIVKTTTQLTFTGDGYHFLVDKRKNNLCDAIDARILHRCSEGENFVEIFKGTIFVSNGDSVQFNPIKCTVEAEIEDANFGARIENNKRIKAFIGVPKSKNEVDIDAAASTEITFVNMSTGVDIAARTCYSVDESFRFLIDFMSDGKLNYTSNYFSTGDGKDWFITTGEEIRTTNDSESPYFSFEQLFNEMVAQANISFAIENGDTVRIEPEPDLFVDSTLFTIDGITDAKEYIDNTKLYDKVVTGSENVTEDPAGSTDFPSGFRFVGWNQEEYHLLGECNGAESLDIESTDFIIDHNSIQAAIQGTDTNDDENFLIWANSSTNKVETTQLFGLGFFFYNVTFNNENKISRHFGAIPNSIALFVQDPDLNTGFKARPSSDDGQTNDFNTIVEFNDDTPPPSDVFDNQGDFDTANFWYDVPVDGTYSFRTKIDLAYAYSSPFDITYTIERLDSGGVLIENLAQFTQRLAGSGTFTFFLTAGIKPLNASDKVRVRLQGVKTGVLGGGTIILKSSTFELLSSQPAVGILETFNLSDVKVLFVEFNHFLTREQFLSLRDNTNQRINVVGDNDFYRAGWANDIEYTINSGETKFKLISNGN